MKIFYLKCKTIENVRYRDILIERFGFHGNQTLESIEKNST